MRRDALTTGLVLAAAGCLSACFWTTTKAEGRALRRDVDAVERRVATRDRNLDEQVVALKDVIEEARRALARNNANLGADVQAMQAELRTMRGQVSLLQRALEDQQGRAAARLDALEKRLATVEPGAGRPRTAAELWSLAGDAWEVGRYGEARELYRELLDRFPGDARSDDAQYFRGESFFAERAWLPAIAEYRRVFDRHATSSLADDALFRAAEAAMQLKSCTEARTYLGLLRERYGGSNLRKKADAMDKDIRANRSRKERCSS